MFNMYQVIQPELRTDSSSSLQAAMANGTQVLLKKALVDQKLLKHKSRGQQTHKQSTEERRL